MAEVTMNVRLIAHTQLEWYFRQDAEKAVMRDLYDGQAVALTAIRTCYSPLKPSDVIIEEGAKYFGQAASDGGSGTDADRLLRHIVKSGHTSTVEHLSFTFAVEGASRALLAQLTRHRHMSFSVQSQRYVKLGSDDKSGGFDYVVPEKIRDNANSLFAFESMMNMVQACYDVLRVEGIPAEDARAVLPNATATNLVLTANLRAILDFYGKRRKGRGAQDEITQLAERIRECVTGVEQWVDALFDVE